MRIVDFEISTKMFKNQMRNKFELNKSIQIKGVYFLN